MRWIAYDILQLNNLVRKSFLMLLVRIAFTKLVSTRHSNAARQNNEYSKTAPKC